MVVISVVNLKEVVMDGIVMMGENGGDWCWW